MPRIEISLPDRIQSDIQMLVEQGEFVTREQAVEELLSIGVSAYDVPDEDGTEVEEELFSQTVEDQQDPAMLDDGDDEYTF